MRYDRDELEGDVEDFELRDDAEFLENIQREEDTVEVIPIDLPYETRDSESIATSLSRFARFMIWFVWGEDVFLTSVGGFLCTGWPGFASEFVYDLMTSEAESWVFIAVSLCMFFIAGGIQIRTSSRDAEFSLLLRDINEYTDDQINLLSYQSSLSRQAMGIAELGYSEENRKVRPHPILANISGRLEKKQQFRREHTQAYSNKCSIHYSILEPIRILSFAVTMGGLIGFCILTPNAVIGRFHKIPKLLFNIIFGVGTVFGLRQGYKEAKRVYYKKMDEKELPDKLVDAELLILNELSTCNSDLARLNRLIEKNSKDFDDRSLSEPTWVPVKDYDDIQTWLSKRAEGAQFKSLGFFSSGGAALFPQRRLKPTLIKSSEEQGESHGSRYGRYTFV